MEYPVDPARIGTLGELIEAGKDLNKYDLKAAAVFCQILEENRGCTTPSQEFLEGLVMDWWRRGGILEIEDVEQRLETFRENHNDMIGMAQRVARFLPDVVRPHLPDNGESAKVLKAALELKQRVEDIREKVEKISVGPKPPTIRAKKKAAA
ncbi:MAG TPA: hypothetical protein VGK29_01845 [Paludibaculum sp.]|jgi:hypothetical protein